MSPHVTRRALLTATASTPNDYFHGSFHCGGAMSDRFISRYVIMTSLTAQTQSYTVSSRRVSTSGMAEKPVKSSKMNGPGVWNAKNDDARHRKITRFSWTSKFVTVSVMTEQRTLLL
jgi:hypothetical protein